MKHSPGIAIAPDGSIRNCSRCGQAFLVASEDDCFASRPNLEAGDVPRPAQIRDGSFPSLDAVEALFDDGFADNDDDKPEGM
jgi:hypothetical protein